MPKILTTWELYDILCNHLAKYSTSLTSLKTTVSENNSMLCHITITEPVSEQLKLNSSISITVDVFGNIKEHTSKVSTSQKIQ